MNHRRIGRSRLVQAMVTAGLIALGTGDALAGGVMLYEIGSADVGLASAGYGARAQDASTLMTNPAGMTRLDGTQVEVAAQAVYGNVKLSFTQPTAPDMTPSGGDGGNAVGWMPGGGTFVSHSVSPSLKVGFGIGGNFGGVTKYEDDWRGRYYARESTLLGISLLPSVAYRFNDNLSVGASLNAMYGMLKNRVGVNNFAPGFGDGNLKLEDNRWGFGANVGLLYELDRATRVGVTWNSEIDLDFRAHAEFSDIAPGLNAVLRARGLQDANVALGIKVPQGVMASVFHQIDERWAVLGSVGWQQWSKFGQVSVGVESSNPTSLTTSLNFKDTWHAALGAQYRPQGGPWLYNFGLAYDSDFQDGNNVSPSLPSNEGWRFGVGATMQSSSTFSWGVAAEYLYGGSVSVNKQGVLPVSRGGRGDLIGSYGHTDVVFLSANWNWKF